MQLWLEGQLMLVNCWLLLQLHEVAAVLLLQVQLFQLLLLCQIQLLLHLGHVGGDMQGRHQVRLRIQLHGWVLLHGLRQLHMLLWQLVLQLWCSGRGEQLWGCSR